MKYLAGLLIATLLLAGCSSPKRTVTYHGTKTTNLEEKKMPSVEEKR